MGLFKNKNTSKLIFLKNNNQKEKQSSNEKDGKSNAETKKNLKRKWKQDNEIDYNSNTKSNEKKKNKNSKRKCAQNNNNPNKKLKTEKVQFKNEKSKNLNQTTDNQNKKNKIINKTYESKDDINDNINFKRKSNENLFGKVDAKLNDEMKNFKRKKWKKYKNDKFKTEKVQVKSSDKKKTKHLINQTPNDRSNNLMEKAKNQLMSSKFRFVNEYLYSHSSHEVKTYMTQELFNIYHDIYDKIVNKWPIKPIDYIVGELKKVQNKNKLTIADLGCGKQPMIKLKIPKATVYSYDLISNHNDIVACDITKLPLSNSICDYVVFSLSLMSSNLNDCIIEANRILKTNGRLLIVEVVSRFEGNEDNFIDLMIKYGFSLNNKKSLPPNSYFIYFEFIKNDNCKKASKLPNIILKSCNYKAR